MKAYYNEIDPVCAQWLRNLIDAGHIAPGDVDERSIEDVVPTELVGYTQCHFFAGIACWSYALRRAGWDDSRRVWTGSCPCQPFSQAGKGKGTADERHLWPAFFHLIQHGKPRGVPLFGEQVASKDGLAWLDVVQSDMEGEGYTFWPLDLSASSFGAPHIRQRLYFYATVDGVALGDSINAGLQGLSRDVGHGDQPGRFGAHATGSVAKAGTVGVLADAGRFDRAGRGDVGDVGDQTPGDQGAGEERERLRDPAHDCSPDGRMANPRHGQHSGRDPVRSAEGESRCATSTGEGARTERVGALDDAAVRSPSNGMADAHLEDQSGGRVQGSGQCDGQGDGSACERPSGLCAFDSELPGPTNGFWRDVDWIFCRDGKWRAVRPGSQPLADRTPGRVGELRAYGNSLCAETAVEFIKAVM